MSEHERAKKIINFSLKTQWKKRNKTKVKLSYLEIRNKIRYVKNNRQLEEIIEKFRYMNTTLGGIISGSRFQS